MERSVYGLACHDLGMSTLEIIARAGHPDFLDLDWDSPLRSWTGGRLVDVARGVSRHVVRFVDYDGVVYAVKETTPEMATGEYALLRGLADRGLPVVEAVGVVSKRNVGRMEKWNAEVLGKPNIGRLKINYLC